MNFYPKDGFVLEFTAYEGKMMKEVALSSFTLHDACRSFSFHA